MAEAEPVNLAEPIEQSGAEAIPTIEPVRRAISEQGQMRLSELREELGRDDEYLAVDLLELVERGEISIFPVGEVVLVSPE